jgi:WD40 repeat protein/serine/threonine protein kinase
VSSPEESGDALAGRTLGDFVLRDRLGEGGMGAVYRAEQSILGREAVIKVPLVRHRGEQSVIQRFLHEARLASRLDHPYAAHVYSFGAESDGLLWFAMELVNGTPLDVFLRSTGSLTLERFVPLLERICEVVHTAHDQGLVHRDLKPSNIMVLSRAGRLLPKLLDFGIARAIQGSEKGSRLAGQQTSPKRRDAMSIVGSPLYMSPEQWVKPDGVGPPADIYSLGILSFEILRGRPPFLGDLVAIARAHASGRLPPLGEPFPPALDEVLRKATAKKPAERYANALEFAAAFRSASGVGTERSALPQLHEVIRDEALSSLPQPIAEAVAVLDGAASPHQAHDALGLIVRTLARYVGLVALAARIRLGPPPEGDSPEVEELLRRVYQGELNSTDWVGLASLLTQPFKSARDAHVLPELVEFFSREGGSPFQPLLEARAAAGGAAADREDKVRGYLTTELPLLGALLQELNFLSGYELAVPRGDVAELWTGLRRSPRPRRTLAAPLPESGKPVLVGSDGTALLALAPLLQIGAPMAGAADELFLFAGRGNRGARLSALPHVFELQDSSFWDWFKERLLRDTSDIEADLGLSERAPYRGLSAFSAKDADLFFGREREVQATVNRLRVQAFLAVVGRSGSGKSSFVQAGVIPSLPEGWRALVLRPGATPLAALAACLGHEGIATEQLPQRLEAEPTLLRRLLGAAHPGGVTVLVIDQFEETLTLCPDPAERNLFARSLFAAADPHEPVRVMLTMRDDFLLRAEELPALRSHLGHSLVLITAPGADDLLRIVTEPAKKMGYGFDDPNLPDAMVKEVLDQPGGLPLLSFAASLLWEKRDRRFKQLQRKSYEAMGAVGGALAKHAEAVLSEMSQEEQRLVREAFRRLVTAEGTRQILDRNEMLEVLGTGRTADRVVERLINSRLVVGSEGASGQEQVEVAHETLITAWPRLVDWRREDAEGARLQDQLRSAARQWDERGRARGLLWRDEALGEYRLWRRRYAGRLTEIEQAFGDASVVQAERSQRRRRLLLIASFSVLVVFLLVVAVLGQRARVASRVAQARLAQSYLEEGRHALLVDKPFEALAYLREALGIGVDTAAARFMREVALSPARAQLFRTAPQQGRLWDGGFSPNGESFAMAGDQGIAEIVAASDGRVLARLAGHQGPIMAASYSPDGRQLATGGADKTARIWDVTSGRLLATKSHPCGVGSLVFSPNGRQLATACDDGTAFIWDLGKDAPLRTSKEPGNAQAIDWSPDGRYVAIAGNAETGIARLWDVVHDNVIKLKHQDRVRAAVFDRQSGRLATASWDGSARIWEVSSGKLLQEFRQSTNRPEHVAFSPDGKKLLGTFRDGTSQIWDTLTGKTLQTLRGHRAVVWFGEFDPDGRRVITASDDGSARVWDGATGQTLSILSGHPATVFRARFSPDHGRKALTLSWDGSAVVWDTAAFGAQRRWAAPPDLNPNAEGDSPCELPSIYGTKVLAPCVRGTFVLDVDRDEVAKLEGAALGVVTADHAQAITARGPKLSVWRLADVTKLRSIELPSRITSMAILADDAVLLGGADGALRRLRRDALAPEPLARRHEGAVGALAASHDRSSVAIAWGDGSVEVSGMSPDGGASPVWKGLKSIAHLEISDDGKRLAGGAENSPQVALWTTARPGDAQLLEGHRGGILNVHFDRAGDQIVTCSMDSTARVWNARRGAPVSVLTGTNYFADATFDSTGSLVLALGGDGNLYAFEASTGKNLYVFAGAFPMGMGILAIDHASGGFATIAWEGDLTVWRLPIGGSASLVDQRQELERLFECASPFAFDPIQSKIVERRPSPCPPARSP